MRAVERSWTFFKVIAGSRLPGNNTCSSFSSKRHAPVLRKVSVSSCRSIYNDPSSKSRGIRQDSTSFFLLRDRPCRCKLLRTVRGWYFAIYVRGEQRGTAVGQRLDFRESLGKYNFHNRLIAPSSENWPTQTRRVINARFTTPCVSSYRSSVKMDPHCWKSIPRKTVPLSARSTVLIIVRHETKALHSNKCNFQFTFICATLQDYTYINIRYQQCDLFISLTNAKLISISMAKNQRLRQFQIYNKKEHNNKS